MSKQTEALKLALEALEMWCPMTATYLNTRDEAIIAIREALAEQPAIKQDLTPEQPAQQQEPVEREHITDGSPCWCEAETNYKDPETGISVIVHKEPQ